MEVKINVPKENAGTQIIDMKENGKLTFLHTPRTGGSSLNAWAYNNKKPEWDSYKFDVHHTLDKIQSLYVNGELFDLGKKVTIVRHPYMRMLSFWSFINRHNFDKPLPFAAWWRGNRHQINMMRSRPQSMWWKGCDIILRHEDLNNEVATKVAPLMQTTNGLEGYRFNYYDIDRSLVDVHEIIPKDILAEIRELDKETFDEFGYGEYD